ncbi:MAG: hypothetical protein CVU43_17035 [Chloroflexi bacterium HGW-Chloroflexi-5]|jgi:uncharacterized protein YjiK|nr:MAG: hypothetical protein CVU43_17035 [Chloroflexi bacterium HGW-Chloroflexi-5]
MRSTAKVVGLDQVIKNVQGFQKQLFQQFGGIVKEGADIVKDEAKAKVRKKSHATEEGIISTITWDKDKSKAFAGVGMDPAMNDVFVKISRSGKRYYYPASLEYMQGGKYAFLHPALKKKRAAVRKLFAGKVSALVQGAKL